MSDYMNGKIYRIINRSLGLVYIGSTTKTLNERLKEHINAYKTYWRNGSGAYYSSFQLFHDDDFHECTIELIKNFPCSTRKELHKEEGNEMIKFRERNVQLYLVNSNKAGERTREEILDYLKEYYINNLDKLKEYKAQRVQCDCGGHYQRSNKCFHANTKKHQNWLTT